MIRPLSLLVLGAYFAISPCANAQTPQSSNSPLRETRQGRAALRQATLLKVRSSRTIPVPAFSYTSHPQNDGNGNLFFWVTAGHAPVGVFELTQPDEGDSKMFKLPSDLAKEYDPVNFAVTPSGRVFILGVN